LYDRRTNKYFTVGRNVFSLIPLNIKDCHGIGNEPPPRDPEQNVELLDGMESDGWTMIKFRRQIASCEEGYDLEITVRLIFDYVNKQEASNYFLF